MMNDELGGYAAGLPVCILRKDAISCPVAQLGARSVMLRIPLPEYTDGTLRKLTAIRELIPLSLGLFYPFVPSHTAH